MNSVTAAVSARLVLCAAPDQACAQMLARTLVNEQWVACANLLPGMLSIYRWQGEVHEDAEVQLILKTDSQHLAGMQARLRELHPYQTPEILVLAVDEGDKEYLAWLSASLR